MQNGTARSLRGIGFLICFATCALSTPTPTTTITLTGMFQDPSWEVFTPVRTTARSGAKRTYPSYAMILRAKPTLTRVGWRT